MVHTKAEVKPTKQVHFPTNLCAVVALKNHITKLLKGHDVDVNLSIKVLMVALGMHRGYLIWGYEKWGDGGCPSTRNSTIPVQTVSYNSHYCCYHYLRISSTQKGLHIR
jgi:hypothetical protein